MSSRRGAAGTNSNPKGKSVSGEPSSNMEQLNHGVAHINLDSPLGDGEWQSVAGKKNKNRAGSSAAKSWGSQNSAPAPRAWGHPDAAQKLGLRTNSGAGRAQGNTWQTQTADSKRPAGRGNGRAQASTRAPENNYLAPQQARGQPLEHGWNWAAVAGSRNQEVGFGQNETSLNPNAVDAEAFNGDNVENGDEDSDVMDDSDDELLSDDFDSDSSQQSHETRKKNKWFKDFFGVLDQLSVDEINEPLRQWHCPACKNGPGSIDWYRGLQPLMTHAKTKGSKRVRLHRELAEILDEELRRRGTSVIPAGEAFGKWKGLKDGERDHEIVWPPMVVIMNTRLEQDENDKWIGMGNQELLDYFHSYAAVKARHSYGPQGHRGISVLIFESTASGYLEAERLHKHFAEQGTDRNAWDTRRVLFRPGGDRQLYGYLAIKEDMDIFNQHSQGKSKLKFEMRSYQEMVVNQIRQMSEENQQLIWFKNKAAKEHRNNKALVETVSIMSQKLRKTDEETRIVRQRTKMQHEQNKEEMDSQEQFFKDQIKIIHEARITKEDNFEKLQQEKREKVKQSNANSLRRLDEVEKFIKVQDEEMEVFVAERDELIKVHEDKKVAMRQRHWEEELELEKEYNTELTRLMEKYSPHAAEDKSTSR